MYHGISQFANRRYRNLGLSPISFAAQVDYLHRNAYTPLNVTQLISTLTNKSPLPERPVVLTFDDGFADFYYNALPILSRYKFTATLYIATSFVERTSLWLRWEKERPMLTWNQIAEISNSSIECGAHTHNHLKLDTLPLTIVRKEILLSKDLLEQHLGQQVTSFAYPYGYYISAIRRLVKEAGFTSACAVKSAMCSDTADHFALERLEVTANMNMDTFHDLLTQEGYSQLRKVYAHARIPVKHMLRYCASSVPRLFRERRDYPYENVE
jgi:peptidoglycan/xylan/chitin deacetylase (PgdA/CDA1 family)